MAEAVEKRRQDFAQQVAKHYSQELYNFLRWKLRDPAEAREVVQATFVRLLESDRVPVGELENTRAWVFRVALNIAVDRQRRCVLSASTFAELETLELPLTDATASPEARAIDRQRMDRFVQTLRSLPERPRRAFMMQRFDGASHDDIAKTFNVSNSMVKKYLRRALSELHKCMDW